MQILINALRQALAECDGMCIVPMHLEEGVTSTLMNALYLGYTPKDKYARLAYYFHQLSEACSPKTPTLKPTTGESP